MAKLTPIRLGTNRVHKDDLPNFEAQCLMEGKELMDKPAKCGKGILHVNVKTSYVPPKTRRTAIKDINLVLKYSRRVYGSCRHAYMGCLALSRYSSILDGKTLANADLSQVIAAHKLVFGYLVSARS